MSAEESALWLENVRYPGKRTASGNTISHSHIKTKRKFKVNLVSKRVYLAHENRWVRLRLSTRMLRTLNRRGASSLIKHYGQDLRVLYKKGSEKSKRTPALTSLRNSDSNPDSDSEHSPK